MHRRFLSALALTLAILGAAPEAAAQPMRGAGGAATRGASHYHDLEIALQDAIASHDIQAVRSRIAPEFQFRSPANAETIDRDAWLRREGRAGGQARIRDVAVNQQGELAIVSFLADTARGTRFIVDVWKGDQLVARYAARAPEAPRPPTRPSGRD